MPRIHSAQTPFNRGRATVKAYCEICNHSPKYRKLEGDETVITDMIADVLLFALRRGIEPSEILQSVTTHVDAERIESCPKCGMQLMREHAIVDHGTGDEAGRTFYYCSERCREKH